MKADEYAAASHLAADVVGEVTLAAHGVHRAILRRVRGAAVPLLPASGPVIDAVDLISTGVYTAVRGTSRGVGAAAAVAAEALGPAQAPSVIDSANGSVVVSALGAAIGDRISEDPRTAALAPAMAFRCEGRSLDPVAARAYVAANSPHGTARVALLVHGLAGHEAQWPDGTSEALTAEGIVCLHLRYTSGQAIHRNGADLAALLGQLIPHAPVGGPEIAELVLIGHSMGGLVIRSALAQAADEPWTKRVRQVVTLGTPHRGAPLEKVAAAGLRAAAMLPETAPIAVFGNQRAIGIKDLRHGALLAEHWQGRDPDRTLRDTTSDTPLPSHVRHLAVVGHLGDGPTHWRTRLFGDGMVRTASASGRGDPADRVEVVRLDRTGHMALLHHPKVTQAILAAVRTG
jgi:pimeloyl-ACP methyl ester carboxylesterase